MRNPLLVCLGLLGLFGCGSSNENIDGPTTPTAVQTKCEGDQPRVQDVRWLGTTAAPGKPPLGGIPAEVGKSVALEQDVSITTRQVKYTPIAEDQNLAIARIAVKRGSEEIELNLSRQLPGGVVCYQQVAGLWVGLVETVPSKAMVRVGLPPKPPAAPPAASKPAP